MFVSGRGEMWRKQGAQQEIVTVEPGVCITIPLGTHFQVRSFGPQALGAVAVTMPPWPGQDEAKVVSGKWQPSVPRAAPQACDDGKRSEPPSG